MFLPRSVLHRIYIKKQQLVAARIRYRYHQHHLPWPPHWLVTSTGVILALTCRLAPILRLGMLPRIPDTHPDLCPTSTCRKTIISGPLSTNLLQIQATLNYCCGDFLGGGVQTMGIIGTPVTTFWYDTSPLIQGLLHPRNQCLPSVQLIPRTIPGILYPSSGGVLSFSLFR